MERQAQRGEIVVSSAPTGTLQHSRPQEQGDELENLLLVLAEARQATVSLPTYEIYASRLAKYELCDIRAAIEKLCLTPRAEGQTAFPDLPTVDAAVRAVRSERWRAERIRAEREQQAAEERDRREHPENYVIFDPLEVLKEVSEKRRQEALNKPARNPSSMSLAS